MKKIASVISILIFVTSSIFANDQKIITVMDFETSGVSEKEMTLIVDFLSSSVSDYEEYILIDRRQREIILSEAQFSNSGCADESCAIEIGQLLSASEMIVGSLGSVGSRYLMNIKLIDVETGKTIKDVSEKYNSIDELVDGCETVISELFIIQKDSTEINLTQSLSQDNAEVKQQIDSTDNNQKDITPTTYTLSDIERLQSRIRTNKDLSSTLYGVGGLLLAVDVIVCIGLPLSGTASIGSTLSAGIPIALLGVAGLYGGARVKKNSEALSIEITNMIEAMSSQ